MKTVVEEIVDRTMGAAIVYESDDVIAFADHEPINSGHILICPVVPYRTFIEVPDEVHVEINSVTKSIYQKMQRVYKPDGISLVQNNGQFNELSHYHLHIFPRYESDGFGWKTKERGIVSISALKESVKELITMN